jgi:hypothetical protein
MFQSLRLVPDRPFADIKHGKNKGLGIIIGNHRSVLLIGYCSVYVIFEKRKCTVKQKLSCSYLTF